jgi:two-component system response regulator YesN
MEVVMYKLYIVDDETTVIEGLTECIDWKAHGIELCGFATDGLCAYEGIASLHPDIVITDIRMPGINGLELIERVNALGSGTKFVIFSGYSEFEFARRALHVKAVNYLVKPVATAELLNAVLSALVTKQRDDRFSELVDETRAQSEQVRLKLLMDAILGNYSVRTANDDEGKNYLVAALLFESGDPPLTPGRWGFWNGKDCWRILRLFDRFLLVLEGDEGIKHAGPLAVQHILPEDLGLPIGGQDAGLHIGISNICDLSGLQNACQEAIRAANYAEYFSLDQVQVSEGRYAIQKPDFSDFLEELNVRLAHHNPEGVAETLRRAFERFRLDRVQQEDMKRFCFDALRSILTILENQFKLRPDCAFSASFNPVIEIDALRSLNDAEIYLSSLHHQAEQYILSKKVHFPSRMVQLLKRYIQDNLEKNLSVEELAAHARRSTSYISDAFKKETSMTILQYITDQRIQRAKVLLIEGQEKIQTISRMVGFNDERYFCLVFKKVTGLTAGEFRRIYLVDSGQENPNRG